MMATQVNRINDFANDVVQIVSAIRLRKFITGEWFLVLMGILSVVFGVIILMNPLLTLAVLIPLAAVFVVIYGLSMIVLAFRVRSLSK